MHAICEARHDNLHQLSVNPLELRLKLGKIVNDEKYITEWHISQLTRLAALAIRHDVVYVAITEQILALLDDRAHLADHAADLVALSLAADRADVRQPLKLAQESTAKVYAVELHITRRMRDGERCDERLQPRTLAGLRRTNQRQMAARTGKIQQQRLLRLFDGLVQQANRHAQWPARGRLRPAAAIQPFQPARPQQLRE